MLDIVDMKMVSYHCSSYIGLPLRKHITPIEHGSDQVASLEPRDVRYDIRYKKAQLAIEKIS